MGRLTLAGKEMLGRIRQRKQCLFVKGGDSRFMGSY